MSFWEELYIKQWGDLMLHQVTNDFEKNKFCYVTATCYDWTRGLRHTWIRAYSYWVQTHLDRPLIFHVCLFASSRVGSLLCQTNRMCICRVPQVSNETWGHFRKSIRNSNIWSCCCRLMSKEKNENFEVLSTFLWEFWLSCNIS